MAKRLWNLPLNEWPSLPAKQHPSKLPTVKEEEPVKPEEQPAREGGNTEIFIWQVCSRALGAHKMADDT